MKMVLDWATVWHQKHDEYFWTKRLKEKELTSEDYCDNYPDESYFGYMYKNYPGTTLEKMKHYLSPNSTVLDIGAGDGAYIVPLARVVREVTTVEP